MVLAAAVVAALALVAVDARTGRVVIAVMLVVVGAALVWLGRDR